jgi:hypothetical protein
MLSHDEHQAMIMFDRLLMAAKDNETIADLLDQTMNVARMIDPAAENEDVVYGPLQRMHFEWQEMRQRMNSLEQRLDSYTRNRNTYPPSTGYDPSTGNYMGTPINTWPNGSWNATSATGGYQEGYGPTPPVYQDHAAEQAYTDRAIKEALRSVMKTTSAGDK